VKGNEKHPNARDLGVCMMKLKDGKFWNVCGVRDIRSTFCYKFSL